VKIETIKTFQQHSSSQSRVFLPDGGGERRFMNLGKGI